MALDRKFFTGNRAKLQAALPSKGTVVIGAHQRMQRSADNDFPFQQNPDFYYLTGIEEPGWTLVIEPNNTWLIAPKANKIQEIFDGSPDRASTALISGVANIEENSQGWAKLKAHKKIFTISPVKESSAVNPSTATLNRKLKKFAKLTYINQIMLDLRAIKSNEEIAQIQKAVDVTVGALSAVKKKLSSYTSEYELEADITASFRRANTHHGYEPIVAGGKRATTLHYLANNQLLTDDLVLIDVGAVSGGYSADITRTYALQKPNQTVKDLHQAVLSVLKESTQKIKPGLSIRDWQLDARKHMGKELKQLGLITSASDERQIFELFPHALSHGLGLDVHDSFGSFKELKPGMVVTVEPGIYSREKGMGIRIEDDVLVTKTGVRVLSKNLPHDL